MIKGFGFAKLLFTFLGFDVTRRRTYMDAKKTIRKAKLSGKSICEYVEDLWDIKGNTDAIIQQIKQTGALEHCNEVCEIGPGTGRYLERILKEVRPSYYHIYEIDKDWANWLQKTYKPFVIAHPADGHSLSATPDNHCGLVCAHGVFVYLPFLTAFEYFSEMVRVCSPGGVIVFDIYSDKCWDKEVINKWLNHSERYPVILPEYRVIEFFEDKGCQIIGRFNARHGHSYSTYLVFKK